MKVNKAFVAIAMLVFVSAFAGNAGAQTTRGALSLKSQVQNFTPIEKAACGPFVGRWCGPWHHRVCGPNGCWCAHC